MPSNEPARLKAGKAFHKSIQADWLFTAQGHTQNERSVPRTSGRKGRADILIDENEDMVTIVEIKNTDWDRMQSHRVRPNALRHARQVWSYIEAQVNLRGKDVCAGVIYPKKPGADGVLQTVEEILNDNGIQVVWQDESVDELKRRNVPMS